MFSIILFVIIIDVIKALNRDVNTFSNYHEIQINALHIEWLLDLNQKIINGTAEYHFNVIKNNIKEIHLDVYQLDIIIVYDYATGTVFKHEVENMGEQSQKQGDRLKIYLPKSYNNGDQVKLRIKYGVTEKARALSFMTKEQTESKVLPYLYSYCQDNNCRSMIPLQDTPSIKQSFSALILVKDPRIKVYMTGNLLEGRPFKRMNAYSESLTEYTNINNYYLIKELRKFNFSYNIKIIYYRFKCIIFHQILKFLVTFWQLWLVIWNKEKWVINKLVVHMLQLSQPVQIKLLKNWNSYKNMLILQPIILDHMHGEIIKQLFYHHHFLLEVWNIHFLLLPVQQLLLGTNQEQVLQFMKLLILGLGIQSHVQIGLICGLMKDSVHFQKERSLNNIMEKIIQKCIHSYQMILCFNRWQDMGWNIHIHHYIQILQERIQMIVNLQVYYCQTKNKVFIIQIQQYYLLQEVPYNKGYQLLVYIEQQIGKQNFQKMLQQYIIQFKWQSIDEDVFYRYLLSWISTNLGKDHASIKEIKTIYKEWVYVPGKPPRQLDFHTDAYDKAMALAKAWLDNKGNKVPDNAEEYKNYIYYQKQQFLNEIASKYADMTDKNYKLIDLTYQLSDQKDSRLLYRWLIGCLRGKFYDRIEVIKNFMGTHGARSWLVNMYETLFKDKPDLAKEWFAEFRDFYHPSVVDALENGIFKNSIGQMVQ